MRLRERYYSQTRCDLCQRWGRYEFVQENEHGGEVVYARCCASHVDATIHAAIAAVQVSDGRATAYDGRREGGNAVKRLYLMAVVSVVSLLATASVALAAPGDPPTFDPSTQLGPKMNDYATSLVTGLVGIYGVVLVIAAVFTLFVIFRKAIGRWIGRGKATSAV